MAKPRKVIRTKNLYKKTLIPPKVAGAITFVMLIVLIIAIGFLLMHEMTTRFGDENENPSNNNVIEESVPSDDVIQTPEITPPPVDIEEEFSDVTIDISKIAFIDSKTITLGESEIEKLLNNFIADDFTSVAFELKPVTGKLSYNSELPEALKYGGIDKENNLLSLDEIVKIAKNNDITPIAYFSTLQDPTAHVQYNTGYAYSTYTTTNWLDNSVSEGGKAWLNPYMENAQDYIEGLVSECYEAGIEVILLDNIIFPTKNTNMLNTIKTTPSKEQILNDFVSIIEKGVPNAKIYRVEDLTFTATLDDYTGENLNMQNYNTVLSRCDAENIAVSMSLDDISKRKEQIILREDLSVDNNVDDIKIYEMLIEKTIDVLNDDVIVVVNSEDYSKVLPVLEELNVINFIVK